MSELPHIYPVQVSWDGEKRGKLQSPGLPALLTATPPQFPGGHEGIWSPEHLFTAAVAGCFMTTFLAIAENSQLPFTSFSCDSKGYLDKVDGRFAMTRVELFPKITIPAEKDRERALKVLEKAEKACLISNSIKTQVIMVPEVNVG